MFELREGDVKSHMRVCSRHFPDGDISKPPNPTLGKGISSPLKKREPRAKRERKREENRQLYDSVSPAPTSSRSVTPSVTSVQQQLLVNSCRVSTLCMSYQVSVDRLQPLLLHHVRLVQRGMS